MHASVSHMHVCACVCMFVAQFELLLLGRLLDRLGLLRLGHGPPLALERRIEALSTSAVMAS